jgi:hypothetical protein
MLACSLPFACVNVTTGQSAGLIGALLLLSLAWMPTKQARSGIMAGLMMLKPHMLGAIGLALLAGRYWRAIVWMVATMVALCLAASIVLGFDIWGKYVALLGLVPRFLSYSQPSLLTNMFSATVSMKLLGASPQVGFEVQAVVSLMGIGAVWRAFSHSSVSWPLRAGIVSLSYFLISPYISYYDMPLLAPAALWLASEAALARRGAAGMLALLMLIALGGQYFSFRGVPLAYGLYLLVIWPYALWRLLAACNQGETVENP